MEGILRILTWSGWVELGFGGRECEVPLGGLGEENSPLEFVLGTGDGCSEEVRKELGEGHFSFGLAADELSGIRI